MKKISLVLLTIALIFLVEIKGQDTTSGNGDDPKEDENENYTSGAENETNTNLTENETNTNENKTNTNENDTYTNENETNTNKTENVTENETESGNGSKEDIGKGKYSPTILLLVLEGFTWNEKSFSFNLFGKKGYGDTKKYSFSIIIRDGRLRNRLRIRNLANEEAYCEEDEDYLIEKIMASGGLSKEEAKKKLEKVYIVCLNAKENLLVLICILLIGETQLMQVLH